MRINLEEGDADVHTFDVRFPEEEECGADTDDADKNLKK